MTDQNSPFNDQSDEYRDQDLAGLFDADPVPAHGPDFWSNLQAELGATTNGAVAKAERLQVPVDESTTPIISLDEQRLNRRRPSPVRLLLGAAALVIVAVGAFSLLDRPGQGGDIATDGPDIAEVNNDNNSDNNNGENRDGPEADATGDGESRSDNKDLSNQDDVAVDPDDRQDQTPQPPSSFPFVDYSMPGAVVNLGSGVALGTSPDGSTILVVDDYAEDTVTGCEGGELLMLYGQDIVTGARRPLLPEGLTVETGGMRMLFADFTQPLDGRPVEVFLADYCDGFRSNTWLATMAGDGTITELTPIDVDSSKDPFSSPAFSSMVVFGQVTRDGAHRLTRDETGLRVTTSDESNDEEWVYPGTISQGGGASFTPRGDTVVFNNAEQTVFWDFRTETNLGIPTGDSLNYEFGRNGELVLLNYLSPTQSFAVINFGDGPDPVHQTGDIGNTAGRCSGNAEFAPLALDTSLPGVVADLARRIDQAAATCDWQALGAMTGESFQLGLDGGNPEADWPVEEANGGSPMGDLRELLRRGSGPDEALVGGSEAIYVWPAVAGKSCEAYTDTDRAELGALGYDAATIAEECEIFGGYVGLRMGITESGEWLYLVAGD